MLCYYYYYNDFKDFYQYDSIKPKPEHWKLSKITYKNSLTNFYTQKKSQNNNKNIKLCIT